MECSICYNHIFKSYTTDCLHHFCQHCLVKWCKNNSTCPKCRSFIIFIKPDPEFDNINSSNNSILPSPLSLSQIFSTDISCNLSLFYIDFHNKSSKNIGITLINNNGLGVKVKNLSNNGLAITSGLKCDQIILFINDIPCFNHKQSIGLIQYNTFLEMPMVLKVLNN